MLPDFPETKATILSDAHGTIQRMIHAQHPVLAEIKSYIQHEGRAMRYEQVGYGEKRQELEAHSFPVEIKVEEVPTLFGNALTEKLRKLADAVGERQMTILLAKHEEATLMTGNRFDAGGRPMNGDLLLQMTETLPIDFDLSGNILPSSTFLTHPDMMPVYKAAIEEIENDPELQARHRDNVSKQYNEWLDRENRRKLVD